MHIRLEVTFLSLAKYGQILHGTGFFLSFYEDDLSPFLLDFSIFFALRYKYCQPTGQQRTCAPPPPASVRKNVFMGPIHNTG
jgi:hypothetical protein